MENLRCEKAVEKKHNGYNCAQAVACSFCKEDVYKRQGSQHLLFFVHVPQDWQSTGYRFHLISISVPHVLR